MWTRKVMKFFSLSTFIYALALFKPVFTSKTFGAELISSHFGIPGLVESEDLKWFQNRWNLRGDSFLKTVLILDLQHPTRFSENRVNLIKYVLGQYNSESENMSLVRVLFDISDYETIIELCLMRYSSNVINAIRDMKLSEEEFSKFYSAIKQSPKMEAFFRELCSNEMSVRVYSRSIVDLEVPEELFITGLSTKTNMIIPVLHDILKNWQNSYDNLIIYERIIKVLDNLNQKLSIEEPIKKALVMLIDNNNENLQLEDLRITASDLGNYYSFQILTEIAFVMKKTLMINQIISTMIIHSKFNEFFKNLYDQGQVDDLKLALIHIIYRSLSRQNQKYLMNDSKEFFYFITINQKVCSVLHNDSELKFTFKSDNQYLINHGLNYEFVKVIELNRTLHELASWFQAFRFESADIYFDFLNIIPRLRGFRDLVDDREVPINMDSLMQIAKTQKLIDWFKRNKIFISFGQEDIKAKSTVKLLEQDNLLSIRGIIAKILCFRYLITWDINEEWMWAKFEILTGNVLLTLLRSEFKNSNFSDSNYFHYRNAFIHVLNSPQRDEIIRTDNSKLREILKKDFPDLFLTRI